MILNLNVMKMYEHVLHLLKKPPSMASGTERFIRLTVGPNSP